MANRLAGMLEVASALTEAVAERITSKELHDQGVADLGALVHRTMLEKPAFCAVRLDEGALLDAAQQITPSSRRDRVRGQRGRPPAP